MRWARLSPATALVALAVARVAVAEPPTGPAPAPPAPPVVATRYLGVGGSRTTEVDGVPSTVLDIPVGLTFGRTWQLGIDSVGSFRSEGQAYAIGACGGVRLGAPDAARLDLLAAAGVRWYVNHGSSYALEHVSGANAVLPYLGARVLAWAPGAVTAGLVAWGHVTLGSAHRHYTRTVCVLECTVTEGEVTYSGAAFGLALAVGQID